MTEHNDKALWEVVDRPQLDHVSSSIRGVTASTRPVDIRHRPDRVGDDAETMEKNRLANLAAKEVDKQRLADRLDAVHSFPVTELT
jgi:hypothetical protein